MRPLRTMNLRRRRKAARQLVEQREAQAEAERISKERMGWREWLAQLGSPFVPTAFQMELMEYLWAQADKNSFCQALKRRQSYSPRRGYALPLMKRPRTRISRFVMIVDDLD